MKNKVILIISFCIFSFTYKCLAQARQKEINHQEQVWVSINTLTRLSDKWGLVADVHEKRNNFLKDPGFHFIRLGVNYWLKDNITFSAGYGHLWLAPTTPGWQTISNENRLYQQVQLTSKVGQISLVQRIRNEQRWQQKIVNDKLTGENKFTNRVRYLLSSTIPVFKNPALPTLVISDELCVQFGREVVYNTFDQNRLFFGIKQRVSKVLSFDIGYMLVNQQKASGYQYDENSTFRWFFYYNPDCRKHISTTKK
jgi:Protein of unknown function (DUF2490)